MGAAQRRCGAAAQQPKQEQMEAAAARCVVRCGLPSLLRMAVAFLLEQLPAGSLAGMPGGTAQRRQWSRAAGAVEAVVAAAQMHGAHQLLAAAMFTALVPLVDTDADAARAGAAGAVGAVAAALLQHAGDTAILAPVCYSLSGLLLHAANHARARQLGVPARLLLALQRHAADERLQRRGLAALAHLCWDADTCAELGEPGADAALAVLRRHAHAGVETLEAATYALAAFASLRGAGSWPSFRALRPGGGAPPLLTDAAARLRAAGRHDGAAEQLAARLRWGACAGCGVLPAAKPLKCARCRAAAYCGAACHVAHWPQHKRACAPRERAPA
jgi:hypothetical protein